MRKDIRLFSDIHHHLQPGEDNSNPDRVASIDYDAVVPAEGYFSIGLHPWSTADIDEAELDRIFDDIAIKAADERAVAIGECGIDRLRGANVELQEKIFRRHITLSEKLGLPLVIHAVHAADIILRLHKELRPKQLWIIHGFRGKKETALQYIDRGIALSICKDSGYLPPEDIPKSMIFSESDDR